MAEFGERFISLFEAKTRALKMRLKKEETWASSILFEYSKYHLKGAEVSCALKKASRISSEANDGVRTLSNRISSVFSSGIAIAGTDLLPIGGYIMAAVEACVILEDEEPVLSIDDLTALCLIPRHLGGFPVVNYPTFCFRGQMDPSLLL